MTAAFNRLSGPVFAYACTLSPLGAHVDGAAITAGKSAALTVDNAYAVMQRCPSIAAVMFTQWSVRRSQARILGGLFA